MIRLNYTRLFIPINRVRKAILMVLIILSGITGLIGQTTIYAGYNTNPPKTIQEALDEIQNSYLNEIDNEFVLDISPGVYNCTGQTGDMGNDQYAGLNFNQFSMEAWGPLIVTVKGHNQINMSDPSAASNTIIKGNNGNSNALHIEHSGYSMMFTVRNIVIDNALHGIETKTIIEAGNQNLTKLIVEDCIITNCHTYDVSVLYNNFMRGGAGIRHFGPCDINNVVISNCNNSGDYELSGLDTNYTKGGGIYLQNDTNKSAIIRNCKIRGNRAMQGGGVYLTGTGPIELAGNEISGNTRLAHDNHSIVIIAGEAEGVYAVDCKNISITGNYINANYENWNLTYLLSSPSELYLKNCGIDQSLTYPTKLYVGNNTIRELSKDGLVINMVSSITNQNTEFTVENNLIYNGYWDGHRGIVCGAYTDINMLNPNSNLCNKFVIRNNDSFLGTNNLEQQEQFAVCQTPSVFSNNISEDPLISWTGSLLWTNYGKSPCIMSAYDPHLEPNAGVFTYHNRDIGAFQYNERPHTMTKYCFPDITHRNGIKWMSFPTWDRLTSNPSILYNAYDVFDPIKNNQVLDNIKFKLPNQGVQTLTFSEDYGWNSENHLVEPTYGYKFTMSAQLQDPVYICSKGLLPDVGTTPIQLFARIDKNNVLPDKENWIGYFVNRTQSPTDAFGPAINNIYFIQTQNWTMARDSEGHWICVGQQNGGKQYTLSYGDMVVVKCYEDMVGENSMHWFTNGPELETYEKEDLEHFHYEERTEYIPIFIDFEGTDLPKEVGIYINEVCKGGAKVIDKLVEVPAYILDGLESYPEIEFRLYYDTKANDVIPLYSSMNSETGVFESKPLIIREKKDYFRVKINTNDSGVSPMPKVYISNYPNPFNPDTNIEYYLPSDTNVSIDIINVKGQKVKSIISDFQSMGIHRVNWDGKDDNGKSISSGVYFASLNYQGHKITQKMILMK